MNSAQDVLISWKILEESDDKSANQELSIRHTGNDSDQVWFWNVGASKGRGGFYVDDIYDIVDV